MTKIIEIKLPEYKIETKPNFSKLGRKVDKIIEKEIPNGEYLERAIGKDDHPNTSLNKLIKTIQELGTDKYDKTRKEVCHKEFKDYNHDIQAGSFKIIDKEIVIDKSYEYSSLFGDIIKKFYTNVLLDRGYRVRIDIILIYDKNKLEKATRERNQTKNLRKELSNCLYKFKNPRNKKDALVAIIKILR